MGKIGYKHTPEAIEKIREARQGKKYEEIFGVERAKKYKEECSKRQKRLWKDREYRYHTSKAHVGNAGYWTGKKRPDMIGNKFAYHNGKSINDGRIRILAKEHPNTDVKGYVYEHRLIMEKHINRYLKPEEEVHHIDGNGLNNELDNLVLFPSKSAHIRFHRLQEVNHGIRWGNKN